MLDPRELSPGFQELPLEVQSLVREGWQADDERDRQLVLLRVADRKLAILHALLLFVPVHALVQGLAPLPMACAAVVSAAVGESWSRFHSGQVATPAIAAVAFLLLELPWFPSNPFRILGLLAATGFVAMCAAYLGLRRELRIME